MLVSTPAPKSMTVMRDMPQTIAKVREMLWATNIKFTEVETKSAYNSILKCVFTIPAALTVNFTVKADIEGRRLLFYGKNVLRLGTDDFSVPADELSEAVLEELAKMLIGQKSDFLRYRAVLPRACLPLLGNTSAEVTATDDRRLHFDAWEGFLESFHGLSVIRTEQRDGESTFLRRPLDPVVPRNLPVGQRLRWRWGRTGTGWYGRRGGGFAAASDCQPSDS